MAVHAAFQGLFFILLEGVGGHGQNGDGGKRLVLQLTDAGGGLIAVHHGHLHVHQHQLVVAGFGFLQHIQRNLAVLRHIDGKSGLA